MFASQRQAGCCQQESRNVIPSYPRVNIKVIPALPWPGVPEQLHGRVGKVINP